VLGIGAWSASVALASERVHVDATQQHETRSDDLGQGQSAAWKVAGCRRDLEDATGLFWAANLWNARPPGLGIKTMAGGVVAPAEVRFVAAS
jgi:hypothetical protein